MVNRKFIKACAVSPVVAALAVFLLVLPQSLSAALLSAGICAVVSYVVALVFGIPCHLLLVKLNATGSIMYMAAGFMIGAIVPTYFLLFLGEPIQYVTEFIQYEPLILGQALLFFGLLGTLVAYVFWRFVRLDRQAEGSGSIRG